MRIEPASSLVNDVQFRRLKLALAEAMQSMQPKIDKLKYGEEDEDDEEDGDGDGKKDDDKANDDDVMPIQYFNVPDDVFQTLLGLTWEQEDLFFLNLSKPYSWKPHEFKNFHIELQLALPVPHDELNRQFANITWHYDRVRDDIDEHVAKRAADAAAMSAAENGDDDEDDKKGAADDNQDVVFVGSRKRSFDEL